MVWCEEGSAPAYLAGERWFSSGPAYPDSLGINAQNWDSLNTAATVGDVSAANQIRVARAIQIDPPDQSAVPGVSRAGCAPW